MKFLKLNLSWLFYLDFTVFHILWKRLGTNRRNRRSVCSHNLFWSEMGWDSCYGWSVARAGYGLSRKDRLRWWGMHGVVGVFVVRVPQRFLKLFLLAEWGVSWELWGRPSSRSAGVMLVGACRSLSATEWGVVDIVYLDFLRVVAMSLVTSSSTKWWKYRLDRWTVR